MFPAIWILLSLTEQYVHICELEALLMNLDVAGLQVPKLHHTAMRTLHILRCIAGYTI